MAARRVKQGLHGQRSVSVGVQAFMAGPLLTRGPRVREVNASSIPFFPISKTILSCVQSVPMKRPKLTAVIVAYYGERARMHAALTDTHGNTLTCAWVLQTNTYRVY